ncbi:aldehyde:ferredoxin oxidoreductase [Candidatus Bathyarchaeota archaeon RBG_13_38_9]|nr:MAG: aldehyde:ferredoxin oxidoreductase [Candidatus Bathyarchaeota archaeon RBG_13_38_9]
MNDTLSNILHIDLSRKRFWTEDRNELFNEMIGGSGVAINLLEQECPKGIDPLAPENPIILAVGPLTGLYPIASKTVAMFKSPLTGNLGESHCGGRSAVAIRFAGYGAIIIKGASETPVYLSIHGDKVRFRDASVIWNMANSYTVGRILREKESGSGIRSIMRIGRAGENQVSYASVVTETYRHFGRLGLGAVFGSKQLKALVISGKKNIPVSDMKGYRETYKEIFKLLSTAEMRKYHELGTSMNIIPLNKLGALPAKNLQTSKFENAEAISGETFEKNFLGRRVSCAHCPVACIHLAALREAYESEPYFYKTEMISYDYELIYALGSMLGITSPQALLKLMDEVEILGLDAMSTGVALAWATEAQQKEIITTKETNGLKLKWNDEESYSKAINYIAAQVNEFYKTLGKGVTYASSKYGGKEFALAFGGNEMPGYHTGPATHLGFLIGSRHSHLDGAGYSIDQKALAKNSKPSATEIIDKLIEEEAWRQILSSLVICFFARGIYKPELISKAFKPIGKEFTEEQLKTIGLRILKQKYRFKKREGFSLKNLEIPERIFQTETPSGKLSKEIFNEGLKIAELKLTSI